MADQTPGSQLFTGDPRTAPAGTQIGYWPNTGMVIAQGDGKFYVMKNGSKVYVPPQVVQQGYHPTDATGNERSLTPDEVGDRTAKNVPTAGLFTKAGEFDPSTGTFKQTTNWNNIMAMAVGGLLTAGVANAIMSGGAVAAPTGGTVAAADVVPASATEAATLPALTEATASGAATGAEAAGVPVAAGAGGSAATTAGTSLAGLAPTEGGVGPLAGGYGGATTVADVPASIAAPSGGSSIATAINTGTKIANLANKVGQTLSGAGTDANGNPIAAPQGSADAARAQALTNNRYLGTALDQAGPAADAGSMRNMFRAGLVSRMDPNAPARQIQLRGGAAPISQVNINPSQQSVDFAKQFQDQLTKRMANGQPLTLSGVPAPSQAELDAQQAALNATGATGSTGVQSDLVKTGNAIQQGVKYAGLAKNVWDMGSGAGWW